MLSAIRLPSQIYAIPSLNCILNECRWKRPSLWHISLTRYITVVILIFICIAYISLMNCRIILTIHESAQQSIGVDLFSNNCLDYSILLITYEISSISGINIFVRLRTILFLPHNMGHESSVQVTCCPLYGHATSYTHTSLFILIILLNFLSFFSMLYLYCRV